MARRRLTTMKQKATIKEMDELDKKTLERANEIYSELKWESGMPQYLSLREKEEMWEEAVEQAKNES